MKTKYNNMHFPQNLNVTHKSYTNLHKYQNKYSKMIKLSIIIIVMWVITIRGINGLKSRIYIELDISGWAAYSAANITHIKMTERTAVIMYTKISYICILSILPRYLYVHNKMSSVYTLNLTDVVNRVNNQYYNTHVMHF